MEPIPTAREAAVPWEPLAFLPCQMTDRSGQGNRPELRLVAAVLADALQCVFQNVSAASGPPRRDFLDACHWLWDDSDDWPFAFINVCHLLGLDGAAVRRAVRLVIASRPKRPGPPRLRRR